jgi:hypothetical protein
MYANMVKARGDYQIASKRLNDELAKIEQIYTKAVADGVGEREALRAKEERLESERIVRLQAKQEAAFAKNLAANKAYAEQNKVLSDSQDAVAAKQAAITDAAAISASKMNTMGMVATGALAIIGAKSVDAAGTYAAFDGWYSGGDGPVGGNDQGIVGQLLRWLRRWAIRLTSWSHAAMMVGKSGIAFNDAAEQLKIVKAAAQLTQIEGGNLEDVMNGLTTTMADFHQNAGQAADTAWRAA